MSLAPLHEGSRPCPTPRLPVAVAAAMPPARRSMHRAVHLLFFVVFLAGCWAAAAAATPTPIRAEIDTLLTRLQASGCSFQRNGSWYDGTQAKAHLLRKLDYMERNATLVSTEQFIDYAASSSSATGEPYQVKCGATAPVPSRTWLTRELAVIRSAGSGAAKR